MWRPRSASRDPSRGQSAAREAGDAPSSASPPRPRHRWRRRLIAALVVLLVLALVAVGGIGWIAADRGIHPQLIPPATTLADYPSLKAVAQPVTFRSSTGVTLVGTFFPGASRATIILSHGFQDTQDKMLPWADFLNRSGFSVFVWTMRARDGSGGQFNTFGALEQFDLVSAVDYLTTRPDVDPNRIGALGLSLGGAVTILAAARDPRIKAVVDDCGFSDLQNVIDTSMENFVGIPSWPFGPVAVRIAGWRTGVNVGAIRPVDVIGRISPRPLFIIHGAADRDVLPYNSQRNFAAAGQPKQLWLVPGATHAESLHVAGAQYVQRVDVFFHQALGV